jgi:uncharacterized repeat protein (TIGR02543 family)
MRLRSFIAGLLLCLAQVSAAQQEYIYSYNYLYVTADAGGSVTSVPASIACPGTCTGSYSGGTYTLTATPATGYTFTGWSGDCTGAGTCVVSMSTNHSVIANFAATSPTVAPQAGFWYNPAESGRGFVIEQHSDNKLFIGGFMYDANGNAIWYASGPAVMANGTTYTGEWAQYGGGQTLTGSYKAPAIPNPDVGSISLTFLTATTANLTLPNGVVIPLQRFPF